LLNFSSEKLVFELFVVFLESEKKNDEKEVKSNNSFNKFICGTFSKNYFLMIILSRKFSHFLFFKK
jgi:hypothetical protein